MKFNFLIVNLLFVLFGYSQNAKITGNVTELDSKKPVGFANVYVKGTGSKTETDVNGNYELTVKPGNVTLVVSMVGYKTFEKGISVSAGKTISLDIQLKENTSNIDEVVVKLSTKKTTETALLKEQQKAVEMKQSIGAQEMERKGISDVEEGLTKVTGISKAESRGLFVRGLEDRYNNLLINDLQVPSNSPFKKIIPLDLFPTDIVGVLGVYKTFNPNVPGDFAGATINIETTEPQSSQTKLSVGLGYVSNNNNTDFLIAETANNDQGFFGIQNKNFEIPKEYGSVGGYRLQAQEYIKGYNRNSWNVDRIGAPMNTSISLLHSEKFRFNNNRSFSYLLSLNGDNKYQVRRGAERTFIEGAGEYNNDLLTESYNYQTNASALLGLKYKSNRLQIVSNSMFIRTTESSIEDQTGVLDNQKNNPNRFIRTNQFEQTNYFNNQLGVNYKLTSNDKHIVKGAVSYVKTTYELPDRKFIVGERNSTNTDLVNITYGGNTFNRQNFSIKGNYYVSGLFEYNFKFGKEVNGKTNKLSLGYNSFRNNIASSYRFFATRPNGATGFTANLNDINSNLLSDIENGLIYEREESTPDYKVKLDQFVNAGYLNAFFNLSEKLEINGGVRLEMSDRTIKYRDNSLSFTDPYILNKTNKMYVLPSINSKYSLNDNSNLRFAGSKTITRPVLMELLPITFVDPDGIVKRGDLELKDTENINLDLKYEYFSNSKDMFALGIYGKNIQDPIERIFKASATQLIAYQNSKVANLYGAELEMIFNLGHISNQLDKVSLGFNTSLMKSEVDIDTNNSLENVTSRELQGASNWLVNADIKYDFNLGKKVKNTASIVYGVKGKNIYAVGTAGLDNIYEMPFHKLDFVYSAKLTDNLGVKFSVDNILNPYQRFELGTNNNLAISEPSLVVREYKKGVGFGLNLSYTF